MACVARRGAAPCIRRALLALSVAAATLALPGLAGAHVTWVNPAPRVGTLPEDTASPCGSGAQTAPGTSPNRYQPGAEIGVFFREDHRHTLNFSTARAYFTIAFSAGGGAGFTELKRVDVSSAPVPRTYGNVVVGGPDYVSVKLPATPTEQGVLQLVYHATDGTPDMYSCADVRIAAPAAPPPPPLQLSLEPGVLGDVFELKLGASNGGTTTLTGLTSLVPGGLRLSTDAYPADRRGGVAVIAGPAPELAGSLAPSERRDHVFLLEALSPGFAIASAQASAVDPAGVIREATATAEIEIAHRVPTGLELWAMASSGLAIVLDAAQDDLAAISGRMTAAFYRSLPRWKLEFRDPEPNALERALATQAGLDPKALAWLPDDPGEALRLYSDFEVARTESMLRTLKKHAGDAYTAGLKTPFEFWTDSNARASVGPELTAAALEFGEARDAYLGEAVAFYTDPAKLAAAWQELPAITRETIDGTKALYEKAATAAEKRATAFGKTLVSDPRAAARQLGDGYGALQGEVAYALLEETVGGGVTRALGSVSKALRRSPVLGAVTTLDELTPPVTQPLANRKILGMTEEHATLIQKELIEPINAKFGVDLEAQFRPTNPWSPADAVGKVEAVPAKNLTPVDLVLGADPRSLGKVAIYPPRLPANLEKLPAPRQAELRARFKEKLSEYSAYVGLKRDPKIERMRRALKPGGSTVEISSGGRTTRFELELTEVRNGRTIELQYKRLVVNGDTIVARGGRPRAIGSDYDGHALISAQGGKNLPSSVRSQVELEFMDGMRKLARDHGVPFGFHGFTHNGFDIGAADFRKVLKYLLLHMSDADRQVAAARYAKQFGTTPEALLRDLAEPEFVVKITAGGVTTGPGAGP